MILFTINSTSMESMDAIQHYDIIIIIIWSNITFSCYSFPSPPPSGYLEACIEINHCRMTRMTRVAFCGRKCSPLRSLALVANANTLFKGSPQTLKKSHPNLNLIPNLNNVQVSKRAQEKPLRQILAPCMCIIVTKI